MTSAAPVIANLDLYDWVLPLVREFQKRYELYTILRIQRLRRVTVIYKNGRLDTVRESEIEGVGVQLFSKDGDSVIGSSNDVTETEIPALLERTRQVLLSSAGRLQGRNKEIWSLEPKQARLIIESDLCLDAVGIERLKSELLAHHERIRAVEDERLSVTTRALTVEEEWRIFRGDGSSVHWNAPRFALFDEYVVRGEGSASSTRCNQHGNDLAVLMDAERLARFERMSEERRELARALPGTDQVKGGSYKLVIDAALCKGLAHEAFGHAAESDAIRYHSILGEDEKFRSGLKLCKDTISIIDLSVEGDWAYSPYSANGLERGRVAIIEKGVLSAALSDVYSAKEIGVGITGAARLESYGDVPIPRMSNIRLEVADAIPWPHDPDIVPAEQLHDFLLAKGLMEEEEEVLFLSGYRGGQVNPKLGDYVFNCQAIYRFKDGATSLHPPGIFSGKLLDTLDSIRAGIGALSVHYLGTCGKAGQGVPSSGGGPMFLVIDAHPEINIGGC